MTKTSDSPDSLQEAQPAELIRTLSSAGGISVRTLIGSNLIARAMSLRDLSPTAADALGRTLMGTVLIAVGQAARSSEEPGENTQVQIRGDGPLGSIVAISDSDGRVRGTVSEPSAELRLRDGTPDVARAIGLGTLTVLRHRPGWGEPHSGSVPLTSGEVAADLTLYLSESEQIPSALGLGVAMAEDSTAVVGAGFLVQILPGADEAEIARAEANVKALPRLSELILAGMDGHDLLDRLLDGLGGRERHQSSSLFYCPCDGERALGALSLLERDTLEEIITREGTEEVCCHFCGQRYTFGPSEIATLLPRT
ncbi:MAG: Hsp33 family molecular chaperone HslO [Myxococcota bacterium]|nr:Hsp33 family molecular chaperone HslO [Myxococcota bacterium]